MKTFEQVLDALRSAPSNYDRGAAFEKLMVRYFQLDPLQSSLDSDVWLWMDWPDRDG